LGYVIQIFLKAIVSLLFGSTERKKNEKNPMAMSHLTIVQEPNFKNQNANWLKSNDIN
jgi:hypothetical protein